MTESELPDDFSRALLRADAAIDAFLIVNHWQMLNHLDRLFRAFPYTDAA